MGKKSKEETGAASQQRNTSSSSSNSASASNSLTPGATADVQEDATSTWEATEPTAGFDMDVWEARFPFSDKTSDPLVQELDKAHELFLEGVRLSKTGNLSLASEYIASAYLRDERVVIFHTGDAEKALNLEMCNRIMVQGLSTLVNQYTSHSAIILAVMTTSSQFSDQHTTIVALKGLNTMLDNVSEATLESSSLGQLGGLTRAKIYHWRGHVYTKMLNGRSAIKDWTKALELDPSLAVSRLSRLQAWKATDMKTHAEIHAECTLFLDHVHEDYSESDVIYALLAFATMSDPRLGTYAEAMEYYRKSLQATSRRVELYGPRIEPDRIMRYIRHNMKSDYEQPERESSKMRKLLDGIMHMPSRDAHFGFSVSDYLDQQESASKTKRNFCLNCEKQDGKEGIQLRKCSRCKKVYFCSTECIRANWKEHKVFCNEISGLNLQKAKKPAASLPSGHK